MIETFSRWDAADHLRTREDARPYLEACADEDPGDGSLIRAAQNDVARAGNTAVLAQKAGMNREGLYKALSAEGNPTDCHDTTHNENWRSRAPGGRGAGGFHPDGHDVHAVILLVAHRGREVAQEP